MDGGKMVDSNDKKKRKGVKNIYDRDTGFSIMINLYVIKYIYYHIDKALHFIDEEESVRKKKAFPIYSTNMFPVSRQRFNRINHGKDFEFTRREANSITEAYGIDIKYFRKDDPVAFEINGISDIDWKCFYKTKYEVDYPLPDGFENDESNNVELVLKALVENWETELKREDPLFAICYYFHYGQRFDKPNIIKDLKKLFNEMDYREWDKESITSLKEIMPFLKNHYNYVNSLLTLNRLLNEQAKNKQNPK